MVTDAEKLLPEIEKLLEPFDFDYQGDILRKAIFRIPQRRAAFNAEIDRDDALGKLSDTVHSSGLTLREQKIYYWKLRRLLLRRIGLAAKKQKKQIKGTAARRGLRCQKKSKC